MTEAELKAIHAIGKLEGIIATLECGNREHASGVMGKRPDRRWFVASGPDSRHLQNASVHNKASDARAAYEACPARAKQLFSLDFEPWEGGKNRRVLKEQVH